MGKKSYTVSSHRHDELDTKTFDTQGSALEQARYRQATSYHHDVTTTDTVTDSASGSRASWSR